jgi:hypothetical protein
MRRTVLVLLERTRFMSYPNFAEGELVQEIQAKIIFSQSNALGTF